jgi:hypothetical protein
MSKEETEIFFTISSNDKTPEIGSRAFLKLIIDGNCYEHSNWTTVQENNYEYYVGVGLEGLIVRIVIWNYLAVEVIWN